MSFHYESTVPPVRKVDTKSNLKGRISTAYADTAPSLSLTESTPETSQAEFSKNPDLTSTSHSSFDSFIAGFPQGNSKARDLTGRPTPDDLEKPFSTPPHSRQSSHETSFHITPTRKNSIPVRVSSPRVVANLKPLTLHCEICKSRHTFRTSESDSITIETCNNRPPTPTPAPSVLEIYQLPGYLELNGSGQIVVHSESELLSYVRKIFAQGDPYTGDFPSSRDYCFTTHDTDVLPSMTSTPDSARASYSKGLSKYRGNFTDVDSVATSIKSSTRPSNEPSRAPSPARPPPSVIKGPLEPYIASPSPNTLTKPYSAETPPSRAQSPIAFVQTIVPMDPPPPPRSPRHASASRQSSPRNLHPLGIYSESEVNLPIPTSTEERGRTQDLSRSSRSLSRSGKEFNTQTTAPAELYNSRTEISQELDSDNRPPGLQSSRYAPKQTPSPPKMSRLDRR